MNVQVTWAFTVSFSSLRNWYLYSLGAYNFYILCQMLDWKLYFIMANLLYTITDKLKKKIHMCWLSWHLMTSFPYICSVIDLYYWSYSNATCSYSGKSTHTSAETLWFWECKSLGKFVCHLFMMKVLFNSIIPFPVKKRKKRGKKNSNTNLGENLIMFNLY